MGLKFIDIVHLGKEEYRSHFSLSDKDKYPGLFVSGGLDHGEHWKPASARDRDELVKYLKSLEY
jgi:hypothetical protein